MKTNKNLLKRIDLIIKKEKLFEKVKKLIPNLKNAKIYKNKYIIVEPDDAINNEFRKRKKKK